MLPAQKNLRLPSRNQPGARSLDELLELLRHRARAELVLGTKHPLARGFGRHTAKHYAVKQGVATEPVVAVDTAGNLTSRIEARNGLAILAKNCRVNVDLETAHAVVDHGRDDRNVEGLGLDGRSRDDVVIELLTRTGLAASLVPGLAGGVGRPRAAVGVLLHLLRRLIVRLVRLLEHRHK